LTKPVCDNDPSDSAARIEICRDCNVPQSNFSAVFRPGYSQQKSTVLKGFNIVSDPSLDRQQMARRQIKNFASYVHLDVTRDSLDGNPVLEEQTATRS